MTSTGFAASNRIVALAALVVAAVLVVCGLIVALGANAGQSTSDAQDPRGLDADESASVEQILSTTAAEPTREVIPVTIAAENNPIETTTTATTPTTTTQPPPPVTAAAPAVTTVPAATPFPQTSNSVSLTAATETIRSYLLAAGARSYEEAWTFLSDSEKEANGGFERFVRFWDGIDVVGIDSTRSLGPASQWPGGLTVEALLWFDVTDGDRSSEVIHIDVAEVDGRVILTDYRFIRLR